MAFDPAHTVSIANDWYWQIAENGASLTAEAAANDFARPLLRLLDRAFDVAVEELSLVVTLAERRTTIALAANVNDRVALAHLIADLNRILTSAELGLAFAIMVPRRYELCGTLMPLAELERLSGDPRLLAPVSRRTSATVSSAAARDIA
jgi:hypothetical protein